MSTRHTAVPIQMTPVQGTYLTPPGATLWANPAWTEIIAATTNEVWLIGFSCYDAPVNDEPAQIEFAVGAPGSEEVIHQYRFEFGVATNSAFQTLMFPVPLGDIPAGSRLSFRVRSNLVSRGGFSFMYQENSDTGHKSTGAMRCWPEGATTLTLTWPMAAWTNSDWVVINPDGGNDVEITVMDFMYRPLLSHRSVVELDLSTGADGEEDLHIVTTKRFIHSPKQYGFVHQVVFPGGFPFPSGTRISFRVRRSETVGVVQTSKFSWNYVYGTRFLGFGS